MKAAITKISLEPSLSACIMKQDGKGVWRGVGGFGGCVGCVCGGRGGAQGFLHVKPGPF